MPQETPAATEFAIDTDMNVGTRSPRKLPNSTISALAQLRPPLKRPKAPLGDRPPARGTKNPRRISANLRKRPRSRRCHWATRSHGLERGEPETFVQAREDQDACGAKKL